MQLFTERAYFSPSVPRHALRLWVDHGGLVARSSSKDQRSQNSAGPGPAAFVFCLGLADPWVGRLSAQPVVVFDAGWIVQSVREGFRVPLVPYVLDENYVPNEYSAVLWRKRRAAPASKTQNAGPGPSRGKRPAQETSSPEQEPRPKKRARMQTSQLPLNFRNTRIHPPPLSSNSNLVQSKTAAATTPRPVRHLDLTAELSRFNKARKFSRYSRPSVRSAKLMVIFRDTEAAGTKTVTPKLKERKNGKSRKG